MISRVNKIWLHIKQARAEHARSMESFQARFHNLDSMFQTLNASVQKLTRNQNQIVHLANQNNFAVHQLTGQMQLERDTKVTFYLGTLPQRAG